MGLSSSQKLGAKRCLFGPDAGDQGAQLFEIEAVDARGVATHYETELVFRDSTEGLGQVVARRRPGALRMGIVRPPEDVLEPDRVAQLDLALGHARSADEHVPT